MDEAPTTDPPARAAFGSDWWGLQMVRIVVALWLAATIFFVLVYVDASFGHDGLHCELGFVWRDVDDACGGFWR